MPRKLDDFLVLVKNPIQDSRDLPPVHLTNPAAEFIDNRVNIKEPRNAEAPTQAAGSLPPGHGTEEQSSPEEIVDPTPQYDEQDKHCRHFVEVLQTFESNLSDKYKTRFDLRTKHTWSEVIEEATTAETKYQKKGDGESPFGKVRGFFRTLQMKSPVAEGWLDLLPSQTEYMSLVCGGFKVILRAATRMNDVKDFVVETLAAIPEEVERAKLRINNNEGLEPSKRLYDSVSHLYVTIFAVLEHIIDWYSQRSAVRQFKAILQQSAYEKKLQDKVNDFREAISSTEKEVSLCSQSRLRDIDSGVSETKSILVEVDSRVSETKSILAEVLQCLENLALSNPKLHSRTGQPLPLCEAPPHRVKAISRQTLCDSVLRYEEAIPQGDLGNIIRRGNQLTLKEQDRIVYVIENQRLRDWLLNPRSSVLLIRGNSTNLDSGASAMSFVTAHIVQSTQQVQKSRIFCLFWFADQHRNTRHDADANVHGIMRSLIGQLLHVSNDFDLHFIKRRTALAVREKNDLQVLCNIFDELIYQLPAKTIAFCVVDSIACMEYEHKEDVQVLVQRLHNVARHASKKGSSFKLLFTHGGGAFRAAAEFGAPREILDVPEDAGGNRMGFNKLMWDDKVGGKVDKMAIRPKR